MFVIESRFHCINLPRPCAEKPMSARKVSVLLPVCVPCEGFSASHVNANEAQRHLLSAISTQISLGKKNRTSAAISLMSSKN